MNNSPKIEEWEIDIVETYHKIERVLNDFKNGATYSDSIDEIQKLLTQIRLELKDEAMKEYGRGQNEGRQIAIEEAKGCVPDERGSNDIWRLGFNDARSQMLENLNKIK